MTPAELSEDEVRVLRYIVDGTANLNDWREFNIFMYKGRKQFGVTVWESAKDGGFLEYDLDNECAPVRAKFTRAGALALAHHEAKKKETKT